jgi:hypothetical protein
MAVQGSNMKMHRPEARLERGEYLARTREYCLRGEQLPQSKLTDADIEDIRSAARQRESLRTHIKNNLTNEALAKKYGVHLRTIDRVTSNNSWWHV